jgi:cytochrome b involved in lipid metabolism
MDLFNHLVSAFIGALIAVLPAGNTGVDTHVAADISATATPAVETVSGLSALRAELIGLQARFSVSGGHFERSQDETPETTESDEHSQFAASTTVGDRHGRGEGELRGRTVSTTASEDVRRSHEDERETGSDDEGDDESEHEGGRGAAIPAAVPSIGAGVSGSVGAQTATPTSFTAAQVAAHASVASCYSSINGAVYDLTSWISQHPGGSAAIKGLCGKDGSAAFNGQHGGQGRPESELAGFKIGTLVK